MADGACGADLLYGNEDERGASERIPSSSVLSAVFSMRSAASCCSLVSSVGLQSLAIKHGYTLLESSDEVCSGVRCLVRHARGP